MNYIGQQLASLAHLAPFADAALRIAVGFLLIPHGLRFAFGMFADTGNPNRTIGELARSLDSWGYRPGWLWAPLIAVNHLVAGPLLVLGLFTRPAALMATLFLTVACFERWRVGKWFWNKLGVEYTLLWAIAAFHILVSGPGPFSLDRALGLVAH
jgi:putative oxidoreductase